MNATINFLKQVQLELLTLSAMAVAYPSWDNADARQRINEVWHDLPTQDRKPYNQRVSIQGLCESPRDLLISMGFLPSPANENVLLIPLWVYNYIADGQSLVRVDGKPAIKKTGAQDLETKFGCIAFGFPYSGNTKQALVEPEVVVKKSTYTAAAKKYNQKKKLQKAEAEAIVTQFVPQTDIPSYLQPKTTVASAVALPEDVAALPEVQVPGSNGSIVVPVYTPGEFVYEDK